MTQPGAATNEAVPTRSIHAAAASQPQITKPSAAVATRRTFTRELQSSARAERTTATLARVYGTLLGAGIGACVGMLAGWPVEIVVLVSALGALFGYVFADQTAAPKRKPRSVEDLIEEGRRLRAAEGRVREPTAEQRTMIDALCPLFVELARIDGDLGSDEVRQVRVFFETTLKFDDVGLEGVRLALKTALAGPPVEIEGLVKQHRAAISPQLRVDVLRAMYELVLSDGQLRRAEHDALRRVVQHFNLSDEQLRDVTREFFGSGQAHYQTLGLTEGASDDEVRTAFRRLAAEHHPDRSASLGPEAAAAAAEKFRLVKDAYEAIKQLRGL